MTSLRQTLLPSSDLLRRLPFGLAARLGQSVSPIINSLRVQRGMVSDVWSFVRLLNMWLGKEVVL